MNLLQLYYFRTVAALEHMTKASEVLHVSQPSLSRTISNLEKELGAELFYRTGRKITLNRYGKAFLKYVNTALDALETGKEEIRVMQGEIHPIVVSCAITGAITDVVDSYRNIDPDTPISFRIDSYDKMGALLQNNEVDFIISDLPLLDIPTDGWTTVSNERLYVLTHRSDPLAKASGVYLSQLADRKLTLPESAAPIRGILNHFLTINGVHLRPSYEINDVYAQLHQVEQGEAVSLIPSSALYDIIVKHNSAGYHAIDRVCAIPVIDDNIAWRIGVSPLTGRTSAEVAWRFYRHCLHTFALRQEEINKTISAFCARSDHET